MEKNKRRKERSHEMLLADDASEAQEWIVEGESLSYDVIGEAMGVNEFLAPRRSGRPTRQLFDEDFESENEEEDEDEDIDVEENAE